MKYPFYLLSAVVILISCSNEPANENQAIDPSKRIEYNDSLLARVRAAGTSITGDLPTSIGYIKYAESIRKWSDLIEGGAPETARMARTAFQVRYPDGWIMIDAGMDRDIHKFFEKNGPQPFDSTRADSVRRAVESAKLIVVTHEHGDHVGGTIHTSDTTIPKKTILTSEQVRTLIDKPQMPEIGLTDEKSSKYIVASFYDIKAVAPGIVLIKAPGHTKGEIMVYVKLLNGKEYLFVGDVTWTYEGAAEKKQKPASERNRLGEDSTYIAHELDWINDLMRKEKVTIVASHDDVMVPKYADSGLLQRGFITK